MGMEGVRGSNPLSSTNFQVRILKVPHIELWLIVTMASMGTAGAPAPCGGLPGGWRAGEGV
jgi:hypothetical protein